MRQIKVELETLIADFQSNVKLFKNTPEEGVLFKSEQLVPRLSIHLFSVSQFEFAFMDLFGCKSDSRIEKGEKSD